jgi:hypothetical protein
MGEAALRNYVRKGLRAKGVLTTHHEDALQSGIPDLSYSGGGHHGWIELKFLKAWPKRKETPVRIAHYTEEQRHFLLSRGRAGGRCWLLLRVGREHLLFNHERAQDIGRHEQRGLYCIANYLWAGGHIDFEQLTWVLL